MKNILIIIILFSHYLSYSQDNGFFGSYSTKQPSIERGGVSLWCYSPSSVFFVGLNNGGYAIKRAGIIFCNNCPDDQLTFPTNPPYVYEWNSDLTYGIEYIKTLSGVSFNNGDVFRQRWFIETTSGSIYYGSIDENTVNCESPGSVDPIVLTNNPTDILKYSATVGGNVISEGSSSVIERGVCYGISINPTTSNSKVSSGTGSGNFSISLTELNSNTIYHERAYAINSIGSTVYGSDITFTTPSEQTNPTLATNTISSTTTNSATSGGNTIFDGNATIIEKGVCWSTSPNPEYSNSKTNEGGGTANFTSNITGLSQNTIYYVRAYAKNRYDSGSFYVYAVGYGQQEIFATTGNFLTVTNDLTAYNVTSTSAQVVGNVTSDGGLSVTARGFVYSLYSSSDPTISSNLGITSNGSGAGSFSGSITGLNQGTTYKFRAYATNSAGTSCGTIVQFTTISTCSILASLTTTAVSNITENSGISGGNISSDGGCTITERGVCWSTSMNPTIYNLKTNNGSGTGSFSSSITGLNCGTTYYVRAYATNGAGTAYGNEVSFITGTTGYPVISLTYAMDASSCGTGGNFTSSLSLAQSACQAFKDYYVDHICTLGQFSGYEFRGQSFSVGTQLYYYNQCNIKQDNGYWIYSPQTSDRSIVYLVNGVIQSITSCP